MNIFNNSKTKLPIRLSSIILSSLELLTIFLVFPKFNGVLSYSFFTTLIILQPLWYFNLTKDTKVKKRKYQIFIIIIITLLIPILIHEALPNYTYNQGKDIIEDYLNEPSAIEYIVDEATPTFLPIVEYNQGFPKEFFMIDRFYYYEIKLHGTMKYLAIDPLTGKITELENSFYH